MDMSIFINEEEGRRHHNMARALAYDFNISETDAFTIYENELIRLLVQARVRDYLPVLTARHVREIVNYL